MTILIRTIAVALAFALAGIATACNGIPQDDRYQTHGNPSWTGFRA